MGLPTPVTGLPDWEVLRDQIDLLAVASDLLGQPQRRKGGKGDWWVCVFHDDRNPSLQVRSATRRWKCFGCGASGDAADLLMKLNPGMTFPEAIRHLAERFLGISSPDQKDSRRDADSPGSEAAGRAAVLELVAEAEAALWTPAGATSLADLRSRGLSDETIRRARLGAVVGERRLDGGGRWVPEGVLIPWFDGRGLALAKVRRHGGLRPKYIEVHRDDPIAFPGLSAIRIGRPLVVVEGEFDALLLGQVLGDSAPVITLGPASERPDGPVLRAAILASPWFIATDADPAGDKLAEAWAETGTCRRVRPPAGSKDWCEARNGGIDLERWWKPVIAGGSPPVSFSWAELASRRWAHGIGDPGPGIEIEAPDPDGPAPEAERSIPGLLAVLNRRGLRIDGEVVRPRIAVGTLTGRVTYTGPAVQTFPSADRLARIGPVVEGRVILRADYGQIEPRIVLAILQKRGLVGWEAGEDLYRTLVADAGSDRAAAKVAVNRAINGGRSDPGAKGRLAEFLEALEAYRVVLAHEARSEGLVRTLSGRAIALGREEPNFAGKAVNRVVQGTAADLFNAAVDDVRKAFESAEIPAAPLLLLFDELWVECDPDSAPAVAELVRTRMEAAGSLIGLSIPVRLEGPLLTGKPTPQGSLKP